MSQRVNVSNSTDSSRGDGRRIDVMIILPSLIAVVGIVANLSVVVTFLYHKKLRCKIPNLFIVNQVSQDVEQNHCPFWFHHFILLFLKHCDALNPNNNNNSLFGPSYLLK